MRSTAARCASSAEIGPMGCEAHASWARTTFQPSIVRSSTVVCTQIGVVSPATITVSTPSSCSRATRSLLATALKRVLRSTRSPSCTTSP
jgi:hypothetical protein